MIERFFHRRYWVVRGGLNSEILMTLVLLLAAALLYGGFLFLRFAEQKLLDRHLKFVLQTVRYVASRQVVRGAVTADLAALDQLQREIGADAWWLYDARLELVANDAFRDVLPLPKMLLREVVLQGRQIVDLRWSPLLGSVFSTAPQDVVWAVVPVSVRNSADGLLAVHVPLGSLKRELRQIQGWIFVYALGYGLVLAAVGFWLLRRNVVLPVKKLLLATEKVTSGDLAVSMAEEGPTEIAQLAAGFNKMTAALRRSQEQTKDYIRSLEKANRELKSAQEEIVRSEKLATVGCLAAGMAHEIGNPLGALMGYLSLLGAELPDGELGRMVRQAGCEAERIDRLVRDLLDYAAPGVADPLPFDPWSAVVASVDLLRSQGALKKIELDFDPERALPPVPIDRDRLIQVMVNLLLNARDACGEDGGTISLYADVTEDEVRLHVKDDGSGIPPAVLEKLFEPFFTTKDPGKGRGLGLAVCQRVLADAGGRIEVSSEEGRGSVFSLVLPRSGGC